MLIDELESCPATHELRLTCIGPIPDRELNLAHGRFFRLLRPHNEGYFRINEWAGGRRHLHAIIRGGESITPSLIADLWQRALPNENLTSHAEPIRTPARLARYLCKLVESPPESFAGKLFTSSRGFFQKAMAEVLQQRKPHVIASTF